LKAHSVERKLAAIFAADVEGYSRLMGLDEVGTLRTRTAYRVIIDRLIASHRGGSSILRATAFLPISRAPSMLCNVLSRFKRQSQRRIQADVPVSTCGSASACTSAT
jgi:hypothetical protein